MPMRYLTTVAAASIPFLVYAMTLVAGGQIVALALVSVVFGAIGYAIGYSIEE